MPSKNEVALLRDQITEEVNRDAVVISTQLFGSSAQGREPDLQRVPDEQLRALYRQKYLDQDRPWLQAEARRDPIQFEKVAREIGVVLPEELPGQVPSPATLPQGPQGVSAQAPVQALQTPMQAAPVTVPVDPLLAQAALQQAAQGPVVPVLPPGPQPVQPPLPPSY
jgi:hypothetical protein